MEFIEPVADAVEGGATADVVNEESTDSAPIIGGGNSSEAFRAGGVPDLGLDLLAVDEELLSLELNADGRLGVGVELVASEPRQQVRLPHRRVSDHHDFEQVILAPALRLRFDFGGGVARFIFQQPRFLQRKKKKKKKKKFQRPVSSPVADTFGRLNLSENLFFWKEIEHQRLAPSPVADTGR